ncbi:LysR family transcriptional regulator [Sulfitobacter sp. EhC04]|uniref:LysR family transcriptional regulator n=1 Tax=Sulfitobacter sp. EhC04 TaxID=1849168 RepID=UPI0007F33A2C|nr:LysR family transcriptional regulator [Sulfitobacter sp. EhC04]OAN75949.1 LysR family transcriptional regulator [Sulfitobacter sp. EhC04]
MDELFANRTFFHVVEQGSFSAAARKMNISVTSAARNVSGLEDKLGVRLLNRTTRQQSLTEVGQMYYDQMTRILHEIDLTKRDAQAYQAGIQGLLKVHLRHSVGSRVILPALPAFLRDHPEITLDVELTDERADLVAEGVDVAVWLGSLEDSSMIARRIDDGRRVICASPAYLEKFGAPASIQALADHNCLVYTARNYANTWNFEKNGENESVQVHGNLRTSSFPVLMEGALKGVGIALLQESSIRSALQSGDLLPVLEGHNVSPTEADIAVYVVYPHRHQISAASRAFIDFLIQLFRRTD